MKRFWIILLSVLLSVCVVVGGALLYIRLFMPELIGAALTYDLTVTVNDPNMGTAVADKTEGREGDLINLEATPNYGYVFVGWYNGSMLVGSDAKISYAMPHKDTTLTAHFTEAVFSLQVLSMNDAYQDTASGDYKYLSKATLSAHEINGYSFAGWYIDNTLISTSPTYELEITGDMTVYAEYYAAEVTIIARPVPEASDVGTPLSQVALLGGKADALGTFAWKDPDATVYPNGEYIVTFTPVLEFLSPVSFIVTVPLRTEILPIPSPSLRDGLLSWNAIENAVGYTVKINDTEYNVGDATSYMLPSEYGEYYVSVRADGDGVNIRSSEYSAVIRYVPAKAASGAIGGKESVYVDGEMVKYAGNFQLLPTVSGSSELSQGRMIEITDDYIRFYVTVDLIEYLKKDTKIQVLKLNDKAYSADAKIEIECEVVLYNPEFYAEVDLGFPVIMEDLALSMTYETMSSTVVNISLNGEFVEPQLRRETLHLLFIDLIGLDKPLYKWDVITLNIPGTFGLLGVELAVAFDAVGAIAAAATFECTEAAEYAMGMQFIKDSKAVFDGYFNRTVSSATREFYLGGEADFDMNFLRVSVSLVVKTHKERISAARLNLDFFNLESDLSGEIHITGNEAEDADAFAGVSGGYRLYGQVSFEYYLELKLRFLFLPLDDFGVKIMDGSIILADWDYSKGGIPKQAFRDEAIDKVTSVSATDGTYFYYKDPDGTLRRVKAGNAYDKSMIFADIEGAEIVDIDNYYIYVLDGSTLRRVGLTAGTERSLLFDVNTVVDSDRSYIYYTTKDAPNTIKYFYRSDYEGREHTLLKLPRGWEAIRQRYDVALECYVIYAENGEGRGAYFTYDGFYIQENPINLHMYWNKMAYGTDVVAFYSLDRAGHLSDGFIRYTDGGVTHDTKAHSMGITPHGLFVVKDSTAENSTLPYELGVYTIENGHAKYIRLCEVASKDTANRVTYENGVSYITDIADGKLRILKTDGTGLYPIVTAMISVPEADRGKTESAILDSKLFVYTREAGETKVLYIINVETLAASPYLVGSTERVFDKAAAEDLILTMGDGYRITGVYLSPLNETELENTMSQLSEMKETYNSLRKLLKEESDPLSKVEQGAEKLQKIFEDHPGIFSLLSTSRSNTAKLSATDLLKLSYGIHEGYVITDAGYLPIRVRITDSRPAELITAETLTFDKGLPTELTYEAKLYDDGGSFEGLAADRDYIIEKGEGDLRYVTFTTSYLLSLPYGENGIVFTREDGEALTFKVNVTDSRSPSDSEFAKTYDKTYDQTLIFTFPMYDEKYITAVEGNGITAYGYSISGNKLTFTKTYLMNLIPGVYTFTMKTAESDVELTVRVIETLAPTLSCDPEFIFSTSNPDLTFHYAQNDASHFEVRINGVKLADHEFMYDRATETVTVPNAYMEKYVPYGKATIRVDSFIPSGDNVYPQVDQVSLVVSDSRAPSVNTDYVAHEMQTNGTDIRIRAHIYTHTLNYVKVDGLSIPFYLDHKDENGEYDYRGGYLTIEAATVSKRLSVGEHTMTVSVGSSEFTIIIYISDQRLPEALDTEVRYNIDVPSSAQFAVGLYNHSFVSISGYDIAEGDYVTRIFEEDASVDIIAVTAAFIKSLNPVNGDRLVFTVTTDVNEFTLTVICYQTPQTPAPAPDDDEYPDPYIPEEQPISATRPTVSPLEATMDLANPADVSFTADYGSNNRFGAISLGYRTLTNGVHYEVSEDGTVITVKADYLATLGYGIHSFTLHGAKGKTAGFSIDIYDSRDPYLEGPVELTYDKYLGISQEFSVVMYDSAAKYVIVNGLRYNSGFSSSATRITLIATLLNQLELGVNELTIGFNDTDSVITVTVTVTDSGLYFDGELSVDKQSVTDDEQSFTLGWWLVEGSVESVECPGLTVVSYDDEGVTLAGFHSAAYGTYPVTVVANGHTLTSKVTVMDSRKPYLDQTEYTFDKGAYEYSLDPSVTKDYDLTVSVNLYDEQLAGADILGNQTLTGSDINYEDYDRVGNSYRISYFYLYRLPLGTYTYTIHTTDGKIQFTVTVTDSHAPQLVGESPLHYDHASAADMRVPMKLFGETVSSLSYVTFKGSEYQAIPRELYTFETDEDGNDVLVIAADFFTGSDIYADYEYQFRVATNSERTLDFGMYMDNAPRRPYSVTFIYTPYHVNPDGSIEPDVTFETQTVYYGEYIQKPEDPTHEYYNFLGFYTEREGGSLVDFSKPVENDIEIFPRWEPKTYHIYAYSNGELIRTYDVKYLSPIPTITDAARTGYVFQKWAMDEALTIRFSLSTMPHTDVNIYAHWEIAEYKVIFKDAGGAVLKTETVEAFQNATPPTDEEMYIDEYHLFKGWDGEYTNVLSNRTLTAVYEVVKFDINYHLDGGSNPSNAPYQYTIDGGVELKTPTKRGYAFLGWYTDPELTQRIYVIPANLPDGIDVYAKWEVGVYGVILHNVINGVEYPYSFPVNSDRISITYDTSYTLPTLKLGNQGYAFLGWYTGENGTGTKYTDLNGASLRTWNDVSVINLYPYVVDIITFSGITYDAENNLSFHINQNMSGGVTINSIELIRYRSVVDSIAEINGAGTYSFASLTEQIEHEVLVTFTYELENIDGPQTTTRSFFVKSCLRDPIDTVEGETVAELLVKRPEFTSYTVNSITVKDALGNDYTQAHVFYPSSASQSLINNTDGWVYVTGLNNNAYYLVTVSVTYTLADYAGTYTAQMVCPVRTNGIMPTVPEPTVSVTNARTETGSDYDYYYYTHNLIISFSDIYLENELTILSYELLNADGSVVFSGNLSSYVADNPNARTVGIDRGLYSNGSSYQFRVYYTYNRQRGEGYVTNSVTSAMFTASLLTERDHTCLVEGTDVTMADGSVKNIEDIRIGDTVLVWNFQTGSFDVSPVVLIHKIQSNNIFYLTFDNGRRVGVSISHGFFSMTHEKFVVLSSENASSFIGTEFAFMENGKMTTAKLIGVELSDEMQTVYGLATAYGYNHFADGLISVLPFEELVNMFDFDGLTFDANAMAEDLAKYGTLDYEVFADILTREQFEALNGSVMSVSVGKGMTTVDELRQLISKYLSELEIVG